MIAGISTAILLTSLLVQHQPLTFLAARQTLRDPLGPTDPAYAINNAGCAAHAQLSQLSSYGCYAKGNSVMTPPAQGTFGNMRRNMFRDGGFRNWDFQSPRIGNLERGLPRSSAESSSTF